MRRRFAKQNFIARRTTLYISQEGDVLKQEQWHRRAEGQTSPLSSHLSVCSQFPTTNIYNFSYKKYCFSKGEVWPTVDLDQGSKSRGLRVNLLLASTCSRCVPAFSPAFHWRHLALLPVSFLCCWKEARQKPGRRSSPACCSPPPHTASCRLVLISGDAEQARRRNYKH